MKVSIRVRKVLHQEETPFQSLLIFESLDLGNVLVLDGALQTTQKDEYFYHEQLIHPAIMVAPDRGLDVLLIGGGDGGAAREILKHPSIRNLHMVEIDERVVTMCREYFPELWKDARGQDIMKDPRYSLTIGDGLEWVRNMKNTGQKVDIVYADVSDPTGPSLSIFGTEFYRNVQAVLQEDGIFAFQAESPLGMGSVHEQILTCARSVFGKVFRYTGPVPTYPGGMWSFGFCSSKNPLLTSPQSFAEVVDRYEALLERGISLRFYDPWWHRHAFTDFV